MAVLYIVVVVVVVVVVISALFPFSIFFACSLGTNLCASGPNYCHHISRVRLVWLAVVAATIAA